MTSKLRRGSCSSKPACDARPTTQPFTTIESIDDDVICTSSPFIDSTLCAPSSLDGDERPFYPYLETSPRNSSLTSLQVQLVDEHDSSNVSAPYYRHSHQHHLPLTPPLVLSPSPSTPLSSASSIPSSSPPASPLTTLGITTTPETDIPTSTPIESHSVNSLVECRVPLTTDTTDVAITVRNESTPIEPVLGEFRRAGSTRRSQRYTPYGVSKRRTTPSGNVSGTECDNDNHTYTDSTTSTITNTTPTTTSSKRSPPKGSLSVDTHLANVQSSVARREAHDSAQQIAIQILSVIRENRFERLTEILHKSKPDLNVFVNGQTALHQCLLLGRDVSWCKELVMAGANPNLSNQDGWHPLHLAAFKGATETLSYLVSCNNQHNQHSLSSSASSAGHGIVHTHSNRATPTERPSQPALSGSNVIPPTSTPIHKVRTDASSAARVGKY